MNEEKARILLRLYKEDLITTDEFLILCKEEPIYMYTSTPNLIHTQPLINTPYYTSGTGTGDVTISTSRSNSTNSASPNLSTHQHSTIGNSFSKKWNNPEEPRI